MLCSSQKGSFSQKPPQVASAKVLEKGRFGPDVFVFGRLFAIFWDLVTSYYMKQVARGSCPVSEAQYSGQEDLARDVTCVQTGFIWSTS